MTRRSRAPRPVPVALLPVVAALACALGLALAPSIARAAPAQIPCSPISGGRFNCQFTAPGNGYSGGSPVLDSSGARVGYLPYGTNYVFCNAVGATVRVGGYYNKVWAFTTAQNGKPGWVNGVYGKGGDNDGGFQGAPSCSGRGTPPGASGSSGSTGTGSGGGSSSSSDAAGVPATPAGSGCVRNAHFGPIDVTGSCLKVDRSGAVFTLSGGAKASINGLMASTAAKGSVLTVDVAHQDIKATGGVSFALGDVPLGSANVDWHPTTPVMLGTSGAATIKGMPISGQVALDFNAKDQLVATANASIGPDFGNVTGSVQIHADLKDGATIDDLHIGLDDSDLKLGSIGLKSAGLDYDAGENIWRGNGQIGLPSGKDVAGSFGIQDGRFHDASINVSGLNIPIGEVLFLQSLGASVAVNPLTIEGSTSFTAGPQLSVFGHKLTALEGDGSLKYTSGSPDSYGVNGDFKLAGFDLAQGHVTYNVGEELDFGGTLDATLAGVGVTADVDGWVEGASKFNVKGHAELDIPGPNPSGTAIVSSDGISACGQASALFYTQTLGVSYRWGASHPDLFTDTCDHSDIEVERAVSRAAPGVVTVALPGQRRGTTLLAIPGTNAAPHVSVTGPGGVSVAAGADGSGYQANAAYLLEAPQQHKTFVVLNHPKKGTYTVSALPGGTPPQTVRTVKQLAPVRISGRVSRASRFRLLRFRARRIAGQSVTFVERGRGIAHTIGTTRTRSGRLRFSPVIGPSGVRTIEAVVTQNGLVRTTRTVARYRYRYDRPARPSRVRITRRGTTVRVSWRHRGRSRGYAVTLEAATGAKYLRVVSKGARHVTFRNVPDVTTDVGVVAQGLPKGDSATGRAHRTVRPHTSRRTKHHRHSSRR